MITLVFTLIVLGIALWLIETYVPMSEPIKMIIRVVIILFSVFLILSAFGVINTPVNLR